MVSILFDTKSQNYASSMSLNGGRKVIILDEADYLSANAQAAFRNAIEEFSSNCSFIFTCNFKNKIIEPLHSRCAVIEFTLKSSEKSAIASQFFKRIQTILSEEQIVYDTPVVAELVKKHFPDFRRVINELQRFSVNGKIDVGVLTQIADVTLKDLMICLKKKDFPTVRKWVANNSDTDHTKIYRKIFDGLSEYLKPTSIPAAVVVLAKYQYQSAFVADQEINLVAFLSEIMVGCEFV